MCRNSQCKHEHNISFNLQYKENDNHNYNLLCIFTHNEEAFCSRYDRSCRRRLLKRTKTEEKLQILKNNCK